MALIVSMEDRMKEINVSNIVDVIAQLCMSANFDLNGDIMAALEAGLKMRNQKLDVYCLPSLLRMPELLPQNV